MASSRSRPALASASFTPTQRRRGLVLLGAFVALRAVVARVWDRYFGGGYSTDPAFLAFFAGVFLVLSVGLVYLGFTRWVGVDVRTWWLDRGQARGDLLWALAGTVLLFAVTVVGVLAATALVPSLASGGAASPAGVDAGPGGSTAALALGLFFGFAVAAFQEETLFRGFLQRVLAERYSERVAVVGQAVAFTAAHLGYYPPSAWPLLGVVAGVGLVTGWLVSRRGTLLSAGIAHGVLG